MGADYPPAAMVKRGLGLHREGYVFSMAQVQETQNITCTTEGCTCTVETVGDTCDEKCDALDEHGVCPCGHPDCEAVDGLDIEQSVFDPHTVGESMTAPTARLDVDPPSDVR